MPHKTPHAWGGEERERNVRTGLDMLSNSDVLPRIVFVTPSSPIRCVQQGFTYMVNAWTRTKNCSPSKDWAPLLAGKRRLCCRHRKFTRGQVYNNNNNNNKSRIFQLRDGTHLSPSAGGITLASRLIQQLARLDHIVFHLYRTQIGGHAHLALAYYHHLFVGV